MFGEIKFQYSSSLSYRIRRMENIDLRVMNINSIASDLAKNTHKWLLGLRKLKSSKTKKKKICKLDLFYELHNEKKLFSIMDERNSAFSLFLLLNYFLQC